LNKLDSVRNWLVATLVKLGLFVAVHRALPPRFGVPVADGEEGNGDCAYVVVT
jgi:hypothetical protein